MSTRGRYPGTRPFSGSHEDQARFFGREREGEQLYLRVLSVSLLLLFARSGLGKTSLLQASLFPRLRAKPFLPVMVRLNVAEESLVEAVARSFNEACKAECLELPELRKDGLWELLSSALVWRGDLLLTPVLVFDQFEEVFTLRDKTFRDGLAEELGALATGVPPERLRPKREDAQEQSEEQPDVKIVISLREDFVGALEEFTLAIPNLFHERLRLKPLTEEGARDAITKPAELVANEGEEPFWAAPFSFEKPALDALIAYLEGGSKVIEPFTLQLLCRHAEAIAHSKGGKCEGLVSLSLAYFNEGKDFAQVLKNFYQGALGRVGADLGGWRARQCRGIVRTWPGGSRRSPALVVGRANPRPVRRRRRSAQHFGARAFGAARAPSREHILRNRPRPFSGIDLCVPAKQAAEEGARAKTEGASANSQRTKANTERAGAKTERARTIKSKLQMGHMGVVCNCLPSGVVNFCCFVLLKLAESFYCRLRTKFG